MSVLKSIEDLINRGFYVFPLGINTKLPAIDDYTGRATQDFAKIENWWRDPVLPYVIHPLNIGVSTSKFKEDLHLLVVDVDNKGDKNGSEEIFKLEMAGKFFPPTFSQRTPTGGSHLFYYTTSPLAQSVCKIGPGIDTRASGGYVVGAGSNIGGNSYSISEDRDVAAAPEWLIRASSLSRERDKRDHPKIANLDFERAKKRAAHYLTHEAPISVKGHGGDQTAFAVAAKVKDFGVPQNETLDLMMTHWHEGCGWSPERLAEKIEHAYTYGTEAPGALAPELDFKPVKDEKKEKHPIHTLNEKHAFIIVEGSSYILWETKDAHGRFKAQHLDHNTFHNKYLSQVFTDGAGKSKPLTKLWMESPERRSYDGLCFLPGKKAPPNFYNLWQGFSVKPLAKDEPVSELAQKSLEAFLEHARENICGGDEKLFRWLIGYFAHMVQRPWEKPLVAIVFKGKKGTGKTALCDRVADLIKAHTLSAANRRYLISNFNGHLENLLFFVLEEAFWSGDKAAEGVLKDLITSSTQLIEHKGEKSYSVANCLRVAIIGNESWVVPASHDERRYAVFNVGNKRLKDRKFFHDMRTGMQEHGGDRLLLSYLLNFSLAEIDVNDAPNTQGLVEQKLATLDPLGQFWLECLEAGRIIESNCGADWPKHFDKDEFRIAYGRYLKSRQITSRVPDSRVIGKILFDYCPSLKTQRESIRGESRKWQYEAPTLEVARKEFKIYLQDENTAWEN